MMKKKLVWLLILVLILNMFLLSACSRRKYDFEAVLDGDNANLSDAPSVNVEKGRIREWPMDEYVMWIIDLPEYGNYEFDMKFSLDDGDTERTATVLLWNLDTGEQYTLSGGYWSTGSWKKTDTTFVAITIPAGHYAVKLIPDEEAGFERFVDLYELNVLGIFEEEEAD